MDAPFGVLLASPGTRKSFNGGRPQKGTKTIKQSIYEKNHLNSLHAYTSSHHATDMRDTSSSPAWENGTIPLLTSTSKQSQQLSSTASWLVQNATPKQNNAPVLVFTPVNENKEIPKGVASATKY